jgi:SET domain-containing protein
MSIALKRNLEKRKTKNGWGVFSRFDILRGDLIYEFIGEIIPKDKLPAIMPEKDPYLQISPNAFIGASGDLDDLVNHSCSPNAGVFIVGNRAFLKSIMLIPAKVEITFDYSTTSSDLASEWAVPCKCGAFNCRKVISGFQFLDQMTKERYIKLGMVPDYLVEKKK